MSLPVTLAAREEPERMLQLKHRPKQKSGTIA